MALLKVFFLLKGSCNQLVEEGGRGSGSRNSHDCNGYRSHKGPTSSCPMRHLPARAVCPGENPLAFLRNQPQFLHMRQAIQQNPNLLSALLQQLGQENPQLLQVRRGAGVWLKMLPASSDHAIGGFSGGGGVDWKGRYHRAIVFLPQQINQHQERFIQMLNEPVGEGGEMGAAGDEGSSVNYIQVTPQEKEAIERVCKECAVNNAGVLSDSGRPPPPPDTLSSLFDS